jgi:hypothetical protein
VANYLFVQSFFNHKFKASPHNMNVSQKFLEETKDIDFAASLRDKGGKKVFTNPNYESKDKQWKMAFRAGKEVIDPARIFVQKWLEEIK